MMLGRIYFGVQALAGAAWWIAVFTLPGVREATLGGLPAVPVAVLDAPLFVLGSALVALGFRIAAWVVVPWTLLVAAALAAYATLTREAGLGAVVMIAASVGSVGAGLLVGWGRIPVERMLVGPLAFRRSRERSARGHLAATLVQMLVLWGLFLVVLPLAITAFEERWRLQLALPDGVRAAGVIVLVLASALGVWSAVVMSVGGEGTPLPAAMPRRLVTSGPYRVVRNPMAVAGIVQGVAVGLALASWLVVLYALAGSIVWNALVRPQEEADLARRFGWEYERYRTRVRCWIPRIRRPREEAGVRYGVATGPQRRRSQRT